MQQEMQRRVPRPVRKRLPRAFWFSVGGFGIALVPAEYLLGGILSNGENAFWPFPWFVSTLGICGIAGVLCALLATGDMESRRVGAILFRGLVGSCCASLLNIGLWLALLLTAGIYGIYHPAPPIATRLAPTLHASWPLLIFILLLFLVAAAFHFVATVLGGILGSLLKSLFVRARNARQLSWP